MKRDARIDAKPLTYQFAITGKVKPYTRMTHRGKFVNERAKAYLASQEAVAYQLKAQMAQQNWSMLPKRTPLKAEIIVTVPKDLYTFDGENTAKALLDSAQRIVFQNDCWIVDERVVKQLGNGYHVLMIVGTV